MSMACQESQAQATVTTAIEVATPATIATAVGAITAPTTTPLRPSRPSVVPTSTVVPNPTSRATEVPTPTPVTPATATPTVVPVAPAPASDSPSGLSVTIASIPGDLPAYDRGDWRHWTDEDGDCQDARQEVLVAEAVVVVTYTDARQCRVASGLWAGLFTGQQFDDPGSLDVDHMVPLANAHRSGAWAWDGAKKRRYANDLSYAGHLIAVQASANRSKGSDGPEEWKPPNRGYWCQYAIDWVVIKDTWELTATEAEAGALSTMLATCATPRSLTVIRSGTSSEAQPGTPVPVATPTPVSAAPQTYASCDDAAAAGEPRVLGSKGSGRGFPKAKVPSARDGDGDGVVCER